MRKVTGFLLIAGFAFYLFTMFFSLPFSESKDPAELTSVGKDILSTSPDRSGAANTVTAVVVQYRGFDTLGEVTVLFVSALGVALLAAGIKDGMLKELFSDDGGFVLQKGSIALLPFIVLVGLYIVFHGHLSPGGGFPGGVIIATSVFIVIMTTNKFTVSGALFSVLETLAGLTFITLGIAGLLGPDASFLANYLPKGSFGALFSAGLIPLLYAVVAIKVASELISIITKLTGASDIPEGGAV